MSLGSVLARNAVLDATVGDARGASIPAVLYLAHFNGDPGGAGTELTSAGGYSRIAVPWTSAVWGTPAGGLVATIVAIQSGVSTGAWSSAITHCAFMDDAAIGAGNMWDYGPLDASVSVTAANQILQYAAGALKIGAA